MSRYALVRNNKVVSTHSGEKPVNGDWWPIVKMWDVPTEYPFSFYTTLSSQAVLTIEQDVVHETLDFALRDVEGIKDDIALAQKRIRQSMQLGSFMLGAVEVTLKDREDSLIIMGLDPTVAVPDFKLGAWTWTALSTVEIVALKAAHQAHVEAAYSWERTANDTVAALTTHAELVTYLDTNPEIILN